MLTTTVGFRDLKFDAEKGFFLNGKNLKLKGICMHHDAGCSWFGSSEGRDIKTP